MLNRCPQSSYEQVCEVVRKELGGTPDQVHMHLFLSKMINTKCNMNCGVYL